MTQNTSDLVAKLAARLAVVGDSVCAATSAMQKADSERAAYKADFDAIERTITGLASHELAELTAKLVDLEQRRTLFVQKETALEQAIANAPEPSRNANERDREADRQAELRLQLQLLREGRMVLAPGVVAGRLDDLNERIAQLKARRDRAKEALESHLQQAQIWLGVPVAEAVTT